MFGITCCLQRDSAVEKLKDKPPSARPGVAQQASSQGNDNSQAQAPLPSNFPPAHTIERSSEVQVNGNVTTSPQGTTAVVAKSLTEPVQTEESLSSRLDVQHLATSSSTSRPGNQLATMSSDNRLVHSIYGIGVGKDTRIYKEQVRRLKPTASPWTVAAQGSLQVPIDSDDFQAGDYEILVDGLQVTGEMIPNARGRRMSVLQKGAMVKVTEVSEVHLEELFEVVRGKISDPYGWITLYQRTTDKRFAREMHLLKVVSIACDPDTMYGVFQDGKVYKQPIRTLTPSSSWILASKELPGEGRKFAIAVDQGIIYGVRFDKKRGIYGEIYWQDVHKMTPSSPWKPATQARKQGVISMAVYRGAMFGVFQDQKVYRQQLQRMMDPHTTWPRASAGDIIGIAIDSVSIGTVYCVGADKKLYMQEMDAMTPESSWVLASSFSVNGITLAQTGELTVTFKPGALGISLDKDSGEVVDVSDDGQALPLGVEVGMRMLLVGNKYFENRLLAQCVQGDSEYKITFMKTNVHRAEKHVDRIMDQWKSLHRVTKPGQGIDLKGSFALSVFDPAAVIVDPIFRRVLQQTIAENHESIEGMKQEWVKILGLVHVQPNDVVRVEYCIELPNLSDVKLVEMTPGMITKTLGSKLIKNGLVGRIVSCIKVFGEVQSTMVGSVLPPHAFHRDDRIADLMSKGHTEEHATLAIGKHSSVEHAEQWIKEKPHEVAGAEHQSTSLSWAARLRNEMKDDDPKSVLLDTIIDGRAMSGLERCTESVKH